jgi:DNA modification methylase
VSTVRWLTGDVFERMADIPDASVDLIVTSPPFLALRSYLPADHPDKAKEIGSEATPAAYLSTLLRLTREWRRILTPFGSICVELGDTYSGFGGAGDNRESSNGGNDFAPRPPRSGRLANYTDNRGNPDGMRDTTFSGGNTRTGGGPGWPLAKSLCGIPTLYAWSLAYGHNLLDGTDVIEPWRVRNLIVWHRPNPPVGALGDKVRPSTSYITTACTSDRRWFDLDAERTAYTENTLRGGTNGGERHKARSAEAAGTGRRPTVPGDVRKLTHDGAPPLDCWIDGDVWTIPTAPYKGAHYATYPAALPRRLIRLMCPMHVCETCGEPRRRITSTDYIDHNGKPVPEDDAWRTGRGGNVLGLSGGKTPANTNVTTLGWSDCGHNNYRRGHVLDPFAGSGTTGQAAIDCGRDCTLIDLDARNLELARQRIGLFLEEPV